MRNFVNAMENEINDRKTLTKNGAVAYETSGKNITDFMFAISALRTADEETITDMFRKVFFEDPKIAMRFLFFVRDCRGGNGEKRIFKSCMKWIAKSRQSYAKAVLELIPEYGTWEDLVSLLNTSLRENILEIIKHQMNEDYLNMRDNKPISLMAKWLPSENSSSKEGRHLSHVVRKYLGFSERYYRRRLSAMRKYLDIVERKMVANEWSEINYETVPSKANLIYKNAFLRHDPLRYNEYLALVANGDAKINASVLQPNDIVAKYCDSSAWWMRRIKEYDATLEELWKNLPDITIGNTLVVRDGSGSMCSTYGGSKVAPMDVATGLAIYMADHNTGIWKDKFVSFSSSPKIVSLKNCANLREKIIHAMEENECSNTNIEATMDLILNTAVKNGCSQEDMPKNIVIVSDMQFDHGTCGRCDKSLFDNIASKYKRAGYLMPRIVFWNVSGSVNKTVPMQKNDLGVVLISGFSVQLLKMVMSGELDPYKAILDILNSERYAPVAKALGSIK